MNSTFVFECLSEEIPFDMQVYALGLMNNYVSEYLTYNKLDFDFHCYVASRRLVVILKDISNIDINASIKGPSENSNIDLVNKFLKKFSDKYGKNFTNKDLEIQQFKNKKYYYLKFKHDKKTVQNVFVDLVKGMLQDFQWKKSMRWGDGSYTWVRPIISILCMFDDNIIPIKFCDTESSNITYGHKFIHNNDPIIIKNASEYMETLLKYDVIVDHVERKDIINKEIQNILATIPGVTTYPDAAKVIDQISAIIEKPYIKLANISSDYKNIPVELIIEIMVKDLKFVPLIDSQGLIQDKFIIVANVPYDSIINGNERVLQSKISDALFFIDHDKKRDPMYYVENLKKVSFHDNLGTIYEKTIRVQALAKYLSIWFPHSSILNIERAALLYKFDTMTMAGKEYTNLQGILGAFYSKIYGEDEQVVSAIKECMYPIHNDDIVTHNFVAASLGIADRLDTLVGFIILGKSPTSSKDPFALRRNVNAIIRTIIENKVYVPLSIIVNKSVSLYPSSILKSQNIQQSKKLTLKFNKKRKDLIQEVNSFIENRVANYFASLDFDLVLIKSLYTFILQPYQMFEHLTVLRNFLETKSGYDVINVYKRLVNIFNEINQNKKFSTKIQTKFFIEQQEKDIHTTLNRYFIESTKAKKSNDLLSLLSILIDCVSLITNFLDSMVINSEVKNVKNNRLAFLYKFICIYNTIVDFDVLKNIYVESNIKCNNL